MSPTADEKSRHDLTNQLAIIHGFAGVLLAEAEAADPRRSDFEEIHRAAATAIELLARMARADAPTPP